ncbi:helicase HerA domain-containing protein [Chenggangzhangella methanolivorans]|uniref:helicase HerA domain-containing protein n=1 Tax=Chenggangzhangella methanolivorans TaxID=1437009 RepID=UPI003621CE81
MTIAIDIGQKANGQPAAFDLEELLATRLLVQGNSGSGKSHLLRRLLEQSAPWVQQCVIDPEGDFVTLADVFGHVVIDAAACEKELVQIADRVRRHRVSVIFNLEGLEVDRQMRAAALFLNGLFEADRDLWYPMLVVVDEAQLFAPAASGDADEEARRQSLAAMTNLMCRGRKRGLAGVIATQRLAKLAKNVAAEASNFLMGRTFLDIDMARAADLLGMERRQAETFRNLERGRFVSLGPAIGRKPEPVKIGAVKTVARGGGPKLTPLPGTAVEDAAGLIFRAGADEQRPARVAPRPAAPDVMAQIDQARRDAEPPAPSDLFAGAERDETIAKIIAEMMQEPDAGFQPVAMLYQDFLVRCRIARLPGEAPDLPRFRKALALAKAGVEQGSATEDDWSQATLIAASLPEDMRGVFLLIAKAALGESPCPSDDDIARAYGTRSSGRARRLLAYMEERGFIQTATDLKGARIVTLPDLGWRTAPGGVGLARVG